MDGTFVLSSLEEKELLHFLADLESELRCEFSPGMKEYCRLDEWTSF